MNHLTRVIPLKLFLDIVPCSSTDITRVLRGCSGGICLHVCRFVSYQSKGKPPTLGEGGGVSSLIFWLQARESRLSVCLNLNVAISDLAVL